MAALPALKRSATSGARMARLDRPITRVYANRPMWQTPERKHWLNEMANQNTYLTHAVGIAGCMVAAQFIVVNFGGSGYEDPKTITREWAHATAAMKMGKRPIYWETKAKPAADDDY